MCLSGNLRPDNRTVHFPRPVLDFEQLDPAIEATISLYELNTRLTKMQMSGEFDRTIIFYLFTRKVSSPFPSSKDFSKKITNKCFEKRIQEGGSHYYDCMGIEGRVNGNEIFYPLPAFWEGNYGIPDHLGLPLGAQVKLFLDNGYANRIVFVPRVRSRQGMVETELPFCGDYVFELLDKSIYKARNEELSKAGIVYFTKEG